MKDHLSWKQEGTVSLWRYTEFPKKFGGWHITANSDGISSLLALLQLLAGTPGAYRTVAVIPPSPAVLRVPNFQKGDALWSAPAKWRLQCTSEDTWQFPLELEPATLTVGGKFLQQLEAGLRGIPKGEGDFGIGLSPPLYFWWWPRSA